jgi:hypothetical protein
MELMLDNGGEDWILQGGVEIARDGEESEKRQEKRGTPHRRRPPAASSGGGRVNGAEGGNFLSTRAYMRMKVLMLIPPLLCPSCRDVCGSEFI